MAESLSPRRPTFRIGALSSFLPLSEDLVSGSTRGQRLPSLIQSRSAANLNDIRALRRPSSITGRAGENDGQDDVESVTSDRDSRSDSREESKRKLQRLMSVGAEVLMAPQMRSQRLIGNSNPRYEW